LAEIALKGGGTPTTRPIRVPSTVGERAVLDAETVARLVEDWLVARA
jgi:hypothetical protein